MEGKTYDIVTVAALRGLLNETTARRALGETPPGADSLVAKGLLKADDVPRLLDDYHANLSKEPKTPVRCGRCGAMMSRRDGELACDPCGIRVAVAGVEASPARYEKRRMLGRGGMGDVWLAFDRKLGREVAFKVLRGQFQDDLARFRREAQMAAKLSHANIVAVHDFGDGPEGPYLVMDLIAGPSADKADLSPREAAEIVRQAAEAVDAAHRAGVMHRDLKPGNILVAEGHAFVSDFGLARPIGSASSLSLTGDIIGTPAFMAPEQAQGRVGDLDARTDVYGLGATLYALAAHRAPFEGVDALGVLRLVVETDPASLRAHPSIDRDLAVIIHKAMEKDPARRYVTAKAMAEDLARYLAGEPIDARAPSLAYRIATRVRRHPLRYVAAAAMIVLALAAGVLALKSAAFRGRLQKSEATLDAESRERRCEQIFATLLPQLWTETLVGGGLYLDPLTEMKPQPHRNEAAEAMAEEAIQKAFRPETRERALQYRGALYVSAGDFKRGREILEATEINEPSTEIFRFCRAYAREMLGKVQPAVDDYDRAAQGSQTPTRIVALLRVGDLLSADGRAPEARTRYKKAFELEKNPARQARIQKRIDGLGADF